MKTQTKRSRRTPAGKPVKLVLVDHGHIELGVMPTGPWHSGDICGYLNQGIAYIDGDRIYKRGLAPDYRPSLMALIIERVTVLPNARWTVADEVKPARKLKAIARNTFKLVAHNDAAGEMTIDPAKGWSPSYICELLNMGIAVIETGGTCILKHNGTGFAEKWSNVAKLVSRHQTAPHYRWHVEADRSRRRVTKAKSTGKK